MSVQINRAPNKKVLEIKFGANTSMHETFDCIEDLIRAGDAMPLGDLLAVRLFDASDDQRRELNECLSDSVQYGELSRHYDALAIYKEQRGVLGVFEIVRVSEEVVDYKVGQLILL